MAKKQHVLVVEDTPDLRTNIVEMLQMENYTVSSAGHGKEALRLLEKKVPDAIITDLLMPEMDGFEFVKAVREQPRWNAIPILVFTAVPPQENMEKILKIGANAYLKKPSTLDELLNGIKNLIKNG
jgi:CheY-like chemotaxis protein